MRSEGKNRRKAVFCVKKRVFRSFTEWKFGFLSFVKKDIKVGFVSFLYGSAYPMSYNIILAEKTWERAKELDAWLHYQEGDVSAGSIGEKEPIE